MLLIFVFYRINCAPSLNSLFNLQFSLFAFPIVCVPIAINYNDSELATFVNSNYGFRPFCQLVMHHSCLAYNYENNVYSKLINIGGTFRLFASHGGTRHNATLCTHVIHLHKDLFGEIRHKFDLRGIKLVFTKLHWNTLSNQE